VNTTELGALIAPASVHARSRASVVIAAPVAKVWRLLTGFVSWPTWNPAVQSFRKFVPGTPSTVFVWRSNGVTITSTLRKVEPLSELVWTGRAFGVAAAHGWHLKPTPEGVLVETEEVFGGWLPRLMPERMQRTLDTALPVWLDALKRAAEGPAAS